MLMQIISNMSILKGNSKIRTNAFFNCSLCNHSSFLFVILFSVIPVNILIAIITKEEQTEQKEKDGILLSRMLTIPRKNCK